MLSTDNVKNRFNELLGKKAPLFISSIISVSKATKQMQQVAQTNPQSILSSAVVAATLDLPINPSLGFAAIVPYGNSAQFQLQYKGLIQLALRSGKMQKLTCSEVYEGEIKKYNKFRDDYEFGDKTSDKVVGYMAYFKTNEGFEKYYYMTIEDVKKHAQKYSKSFSMPNGIWNTNFDAMAKKTVLKLLISKYAPLEVQSMNEMQIAQKFDQGAVSADVLESEAEVIDADVTYVDNEPSEEEVEQLKEEKETNKSAVTEAMNNSKK